MAKPGMQIQNSVSTKETIAQMKELLAGQKDKLLTTDERLDEVALFLAGKSGGNLSGLPGGLNITVTVQVQIPPSRKAPDDGQPTEQ